MTPSEAWCRSPETIWGSSPAGYGQTRRPWPRLAKRSILLVGGWDDTTAPIETVVSSFYRALKRQPEADVTMIVYQDGHSFRSSGEQMAADIRAWLGRRFPR